MENKTVFYNSIRISRCWLLILMWSKEFSNNFFYVWPGKPAINSADKIILQYKISIW